MDKTFEHSWSLSRIPDPSGVHIQTGNFTSVGDQNDWNKSSIDWKKARPFVTLDGICFPWESKNRIE